MNTTNSKTKHLNEFVYNFTDKLNLKILKIKLTKTLH